MHTRGRSVCDPCTTSISCVIHCFQLESGILRCYLYSGPGHLPTPRASLAIQAAIMKSVWGPIYIQWPGKAGARAGATSPQKWKPPRARAWKGIAESREIVPVWAITHLAFLSCSPVSFRRASLSFFGGVLRSLREVLWSFFLPWEGLSTLTGFCPLSPLWQLPCSTCLFREDPDLGLPFVGSFQLDWAWCLSWGRVAVEACFLKGLLDDLSPAKAENGQWWLHKTQPTKASLPCRGWATKIQRAS